MSKQTSTFRFHAFAKLNLALSVGAPTEAPGSSHHGYHPICSYMHSIDLSDEISIERLNDGQASRFEIVWIETDGSTRAVEWEIERDLVFLAHAALETATGRSLPSSIVVRKSIPAGGGLGGGSSDAAAVLMGLDRVFGLGTGLSRLQDIAMTLGSDIGFFIDEQVPARAAIVSGFGESIERVGARHVGTPVTLVLPSFGCSTGAVYRAFDQLRPDAVDELGVRSIPEADDLNKVLLLNDLTSAASVVAPGLGDLIDRIENMVVRQVHMTGSGSTLFVLGRVEAETICEVAPECRIVHTRLV